MGGAQDLDNWLSLAFEKQYRTAPSADFRRSSAWATTAAGHGTLGLSGQARSILADVPEATAFAWSWCGEMSSGSTDVDAYLSAMTTLEAEYPDVTFVYMTGHLDGGALPSTLTTTRFVSTCWITGESSSTLPTSNSMTPMASNTRPPATAASGAARGVPPTPPIVLTLAAVRTAIRSTVVAKGWRFGGCLPASPAGRGCRSIRWIKAESIGSIPGSTVSLSNWRGVQMTSMAQREPGAFAILRIGGRRAGRRPPLRVRRSARHRR